MKRISVILILVLSIFLSLLPVGVQALGENAAEEWEDIPVEDALPAVDEDGEVEAPEAAEPAPAEEDIEAEPAESGEDTVEPEPAEADPSAPEEVPAETVPTEEEIPEAAETVSEETVVTAEAAAAAVAEESPAPAEDGIALAVDGAAVVTAPQTDGATEASGSDAEEVPASSTDVSTNLSKPKVSSVKATTGGVKVTWGKVSGAAKYRVLRKTASGSWKKLGDTASTSFVDKTAKSGTKYYYTVKCISADGKTDTSKYDTTGKSLTYLSAPKVTKAANAAKGVKVTWGKVTGASGYYVYRKTAGGSWKKIATVKGGSTLTYTDTKVKSKSGTKYFYTVQAYTGSKTTSAYDTTGKGIYRLAQPTLVSASSGNKGKATVKWKKVAGATGYYVYRKTAGGSWKKIATVKSATKVSYVDTTAKSGTKYYYTVRAYYSTTTSSYNTTGKAVKIK